MAKTITPLTPEEITSNLEVKWTIKSISQKYPWVLRYSLSNDVNEYNLIFIKLIIDGDMFKSMYGYNYQPWVLRDAINGRDYYGSHLSITFEMTYEEAKEFDIKLDKIIDFVHNSDIVPEEYRLPKDRKLSVLGYIVPSDTVKLT